MTPMIYSTILFLHIAGALALFATFGIEWVSLRQLQRANTAEQVRAVADATTVVLPVSIFAGLAILLAGGYLAAKMNAWGEGWITW